MILRNSIVVVLESEIVCKPHAVQRMDKSYTSSPKSLTKFLCHHLIRYVDVTVVKAQTI